MQREAAEGESKNVSEAKIRVAENESSANIAEAGYRADAHVNVSVVDRRLRDATWINWFLSTKKLNIDG